MPVKDFAPFIWPALAVAAAIYLRAEIRLLVAALVQRLRGGGALKIGPVELNELRVNILPNNDVLIKSGAVSAEDDAEKGFAIKQKLYRENRYVFVSHVLYRSEIIGQDFDILLFLIPRTTSEAPLDPLRAVKEVRYYLGKSWGDKVFVAKNRWDNFAIVFSSWGNTLCFAEIVFDDGAVVEQWRYIDFEMGRLAPTNTKEKKPEK